MTARVAGLNLVLVACLTCVTSLGAQMSPGARSVGMGGGGMVFATGVDAVEWNPANLGWAGGWHVSVFEAGMAGLAEGATIDEMFAILGADLLGAGTLNVAQVVNGLPASGVRVSASTEGYLTAWAAEQADIPRPGSPLPSIGAAFGSFAVRIRSRVFTDISFSREIADLIGNGYVPESIQDYSVGDTGWRATTGSEVTLSYGTTLGDLLSVGIGGRYVKGHGMVSGRFFEPEIDVNCAVAPTPGCNSLTVQAIAVEAVSGSGIGLDFGASLDLPGGFRAAASGTNVVQRMTWDEGLVSHAATFTDQDFDADLDFIDLLDRFDSEPVTANGSSLGVYEAADGLFEGSYFPQTFRGGVGWQSGGTSLEAVGIVVAPRGRLRTAWDQRVSLGVEQVLPVVTLRGGYAMMENGVSALTGGAGLALGPVRFEGSLGRFRGDQEGSPWDGLFSTVSVSVRGGGP